MKKVELLSPAGDLERLKIAVMYGADAVFAGSKEFSLRSRASNFTLEDIKEGAEFCHAHGAKLYITTNIVPHNRDLLGLIDYLQALEEANVDAIIASSPAIISLAKKHTNLEIHISTQQSILNSAGVNFWYNYGATRVVLGREATLDEIAEIRKNTEAELEIFIHGGMCASYSGRCMLSNHMTNRDANRGGCAHSCRWNYSLYSDDELISDDEKFQLSSKDLLAIDNLDKLIPNCDSLKIEGRMKSLHYVATVTKVYRMAIDEFYELGYIKNKEYYRNEIKKAENREFSCGFLEGMPTVNEQLYNCRSENPAQDFVGIVVGYENGKAQIEVRNYFEPNETLEVFGPKTKSTPFKIGKILNDKGEEVDAARHPKSIVTVDSDVVLYPWDMIRVVR